MLENHAVLIFFSGKMTHIRIHQLRMGVRITIEAFVYIVAPMGDPAPWSKCISIERRKKSISMFEMFVDA